MEQPRHDHVFLRRLPVRLQLLEPPELARLLIRDLVPGTQAAPAIGNTPRTLGDARSPTTTTLDVSGSKNFKLFKDGRVQIQIRADAFNILNHPVFFLNPNSRSNGVWEHVASTHSFRAKPTATTMDANNTGQHGNYAGRMFRLGARVTF